MSVRLPSCFAKTARQLAFFSAIWAGSVSSSPAWAVSGSWAVDADGLWETTTNWTGGTVAFGNGTTATFANNITATRTVTLNQTRSVGSLVFGDADPSSVASWVLTRSATESFTLNNNTSSTSFITVNNLGANQTATISLLLGSGANAPLIEKNGSGTLVLTGNNPFTAKLAVTDGILQVNADNQLGGTGTFATDRVTLSNGGTLKTTGAFTMNAARGITVGSGGGVLNVTGGTFTVPTQVSGAGQTLTVTGSTGLSLTNTTGSASDVNWDFSQNSGIRVFFAGSNALGTGAVSVGSGIRLVSQSTAPTAGQVTNAVTLASNGGLTARNNGGAVEYTNVTLPSSGTIVLNKDDALTAALTISSGAVLSGALTVDTSQQATAAVGDVTLSGVFSGASGAITKAGTGSSGRLILNGANTYGGNTTITTGTLALGASGSIANSPVISVAGGTTFDVSAVSGGFTLGASQDLIGAGSVVGNVTSAGAFAPGLSGAIGTLTFTNDVSLGSGSVLNYQLDGANVTVGSTVNDFIDLSGGNLVLDGTINVTESVASSFLSATAGNAWRLMNYSGTLTDNTLSLGTMPTLSSGLQFGIDTGTTGQVNLVVTAVPEPTTLVSGLIGAVFATGFAARRRRKLS